jgi:LPPG:FO 2-phospho-L-lactate transferase
VQEAVAQAETIVIGPSNPIASIGPMLALPGMREALTGADAPVVAVSPLVGGHSLKGPTEAFLGWAGHSVDDGGVAACYAGLAAGMVVDRGTPTGPASTTGIVLRQTDTAMPDAGARERLAHEVIEFALSLGG